MRSSASGWESSSLESESGSDQEEEVTAGSGMGDNKEDDKEVREGTSESLGSR